MCTLDDVQNLKDQTYQPPVMVESETEPETEPEMEPETESEMEPETEPEMVPMEAQYEREEIIYKELLRNDKHWNLDL